MLGHKNQMRFVIFTYLVIDDLYHDRILRKQNYYTENYLRDSVAAHALRKPVDRAK
jgi:hypothetical protein